MNSDSKILSNVEITEQMNTLQSVFRSVRQLLLSNAGSVESTDKQDGSPVTDIDIQVEHIIRARMLDEFPDMTVYGEEAGYSSSLPVSCWLIDPIDGTDSFIKNTGTFTCMAVLVQNDQAVACIIYNPTSDAMYTAIKGSGAYKNGQKLDLNTTPLSSKAFCKGRYIDPLDILFAADKITHHMGPVGAGSGFALVAEGSAAANYKLASKGYIHDYATGCLLVLEAGGSVIATSEDKYSYKTKNLVACHPTLTSSVEKNITEIHLLETTLGKVSN